jgi:hypothetical protein
MKCNMSRSYWTFGSENSSNLKHGSLKKIAEDSKKPSDQMWKKEPSVEKMCLWPQEAGPAVTEF